MRFTKAKITMKRAILAANILLLTSGLAVAQQQVNLTAKPTSTTLPDGTTVPMWGYACTALPSNVTSTATCSALNLSAVSAGQWSPVVITVPTGQSLQINLTNQLSFTPSGSATANKIPTSLMIVGQVGGGLGRGYTGAGGTTVSSPAHPPQADASWSTVGPVPAGQAFTPPAQKNRVQSFGTEVAEGGTASLTWTTPRPGTYLLESGTHPSIQATMGLIGIVVVTQIPSGATPGTAYPQKGTAGYLGSNPNPVTYNAEVPLLLSEIDPAQNKAVNTAVNSLGFNEDATYGLSVNGNIQIISSIAVTSGGSGYTTAPTVNLAGGGGSGATATAIIDTTAGSPTNGQVTAVTINNSGTGYTSAPSITFSSNGSGSGARAQASVGLGYCQGPTGPLPTPSACYPPVVNYTPLYYLVNGVAFNKTSPSSSVFGVVPATALTPLTSNVLVRFVNAGSRMHIPSIVGSIAPNGVTANGVSTGFQLIAEDGNVVPGVTSGKDTSHLNGARVQSEVFMAAGKTYDVMIEAPASGSTALPVFDRQLSLSGNSVNRDSGMLAYISVNAAGLPGAPALQPAQANPDSYNALLPGQTFTVSDPYKGVTANDINVFGVSLLTQPSSGNATVALNADGTFTYTPNSGSTTTTDTFTYCANGSVAAGVCSSGLTATVTLNPSTISTSTITVPNTTWNSKLATFIKVPPPGVLTGATDSNGLPLTITAPSIAAAKASGIILDANGGFTASGTAGTPLSFSFTAQNTVGNTSASASATVNFPQPSHLSVTVTDPRSGATISDYRWIIEEDKSFYIDPGCTQNPPPQYSTVTGQSCIKTSTGTVPILGVNFHTSDMTYVAQGCTGAVSCESGQMVLGQNAVCDVGNGACRTTATQKTSVTLDQVGLLSTAAVDTLGQTLGSLDPAKHYYISVLPGDAANPFESNNTSADCYNNPLSTNNCGHGMGGAPIVATCTPGTAGSGCTLTTFNPVNVLVEQSPYPPAKLAINVFEDDFPLNGEQDSGGGVDILATNEPGLGDFNVVLWDDMGGSGDATGQMTYDMFNQPLSNSLDGTLDPATGNDACPITKSGVTNPTGITGMITVCPKYESDGATLSPLAGEAVVANLMPGRFSVQAIPGADRIAKGEEWLQTNTLDGQKAHDSFLRIGEPAYFQEFGPANYHVSIGFANPAIINARKSAICNGSDPNLTATTCAYTVTGRITGERMSRTPDERLYSSGSYDAYSWTQCYISLGDPDGEDFAFTKCAADGTFTLSKIPQGNWRVTVFDEWNDMIVDGLSTPVGINVSSTQTAQTCPGVKTTITPTGGTCDMGDIATSQWQANVYTKTFIDTSATGVASQSSPGVALVNTTIRYRDGSMANNLGTDFNGVANFNETFPLFNWYAVETDTTRYKNSGTHTVYDAGGPADGSTDPKGNSLCGDGTTYPKCGSSTIAKYLANTYEATPLPSDLFVPGSVYCADADCSNEVKNGGIAGHLNATPTVTNPSCTNSGGTTTCSSNVSTGRIDNPWSGQVEGWQGFSGQGNFIEFGKMPYAPGENGGIHGHVVYASTRPFDDPKQLVQTQWEPLVPNVTMNLYQEGVAADGVTRTLTLVDTTKTSSWDAWAQGFRTVTTTNGTENVPNMNCPGQSTADLFYFSLQNQPQYLDLYANVLHGTGSATIIPYNSQFKCYDGMHNWNQLQPAVYDGMYSFPSVTARDANGKPTLTGTNCTICKNNPDPAPDMYNGIPMLPAGKYVVEVVPPEGYEIVKEEDKNILIGDNFIAPATQQFGGLGDIFILPDQASVAAEANGSNPGGGGTNPNNPQNPSQSLGMNAENGIVPGFVPEPVWPCVGELRVVPDYISLFPQSTQVAPFAGATRNLCDRKEVTLGNQMGAIAKFYIYTSTHKASKFTGVITDDFTSEFDPFSPQFGEKFAPPNMPISVEDWTGTEIGRVYSDWWGDFDGLVYSTWEVNPPNPTGYSPNMMVFCMNDKASSPSAPTDPLYNPAYSQFCYELPYMPGQTQYLDTPVVPTSAFSAGYNHPDCAYPTLTPAVAEVDGDGSGPWVSGANGSGAVTVKLTNGGSGYNSAPAVSFSGGSPAAAVSPIATSIISGPVATIALSTGGSGYTTTPVVSLVGGGGTGAAATASASGPVASVKLTSGGAGYSTAPTVAFQGGGGTGATATAVTSGTITGVSVTNPGKGYTTAPRITFTGGGGSGAAATANLSGSVSTVTFLLGDTGIYSGTTTSITATFSAPGNGGITATGTVTIGNGLLRGTKTITKITVTNPGSGYTSAPTITLTVIGGTTTLPAAPIANLNYSVASVTVTNGGSNYTSAPTVTFAAAPTGGTTATGTAQETGTVVALHLTSGGSGYTSAPTIVFSGGGGSGSAATDTISMAVTSVTLTAAGSGYGSDPQVVFVAPDGNGSGAAATTTISGSVVEVVLNSPGSGYATAPSVNFTNTTPPGSGATATASVTSGTLVITALGDQTVNNYAYSGPGAGTAPYNEKTITRHYGFGGTAGTVALLDSLGVSHPLTNVTWGDTQITGTVPSGLASCGATAANTTGLQQQAAFNNNVKPAAKCGELVITTSTGQKSVDTVMVTVGGKSPIYVSGNTPLSPNGTGSLQHAIDNAQPGDLIMVPKGTYYEMLLMWKPVRLQGVGAASVTIDANTQPAGKMDPWRHQVNCLFGLALNGTPLGATNTPNSKPAQYDPSGTFTCGGWTGFVGAVNNPQVDRVPLEGIVGWDTTTNGNLAQLLQEPTLMGAYEGAGITVLAKGVSVPANASTSYYGNGNEATFPTGTTNLTTANCSSKSGQTTVDNTSNPSSFWCNPSRIDGLGITDSSEGGGGIFTHGWTHNLEISNNRVYSNIGTLSGGMNIGQGEFPDAYLNDTDLDTDPGSCETTSIDPITGFPANSDPANTQEPYCFQMHMNVHHNYVSGNTSIGDELFSGTPAGAGGVTFCTGSDYYMFNFNWVCGNMSTGDGGGFSHLGFIKNGDIEHNTILFNQSLNPTIPTNGGGIIIMGAAPDGNQTINGQSVECGSVTDNDCAPGLSDGTGPGLVINANLIQGNAAEAGSGGGIRFQAVNGTEVPRFPNAPKSWYSVTVTNNMIVNNVAGWDGGGISLQDTLAANIVNNTIASNDTTATAGPLTDTIGSPDASAPPAGSTIASSGTSSLPQPAGLVTMGNSPQLIAALQANPPTPALVCPSNHGGNGSNSSGNAKGSNSCAASSIPYLANDLFWQNRSFYVGVGSSINATYQNKVVTLFNASGSAVTNQSSTGDCSDPATYWDLGARGDSGPGNHGSGVTLSPVYSSFTNSGGTAEAPNSNGNLIGGNPAVDTQYCNGSRTPPEYASTTSGTGTIPTTWNVPPGIADATVPNPLFTLAANATVDEGNNWINLTWGPLTLLNPQTGAYLGKYSLTPGSQDIDQVPTTAASYNPYPVLTFDFFGNPRPDISKTAIDIGAVEFQLPPNTPLLNIKGGPLTFPSTVIGTSSAAQTLTLSNPGSATASGITLTFTGPFSRPAGTSGGNCPTTSPFALNSGASCTISVIYTPTAPPATQDGTLAIGSSNVTTVSGSPVSLSGTGVAAVVTAMVSPSPLAFGSWATGTTSNPMNLTVTNTGNVALANGSYTFGGGPPQTYSRVATGTTCGATLAVGASCTFRVQFAPGTNTGALNRTLTVAFTNTANTINATVTPTPVSLTGTGVATKGTVTVSPNPLKITVPAGTFTGSGMVTFTNSSTSTSSVAITAVNVTGTGILWGWSKGTDTCSGANLAPGASCTVVANFGRIFGTGTLNGTITFTDTATGSPQSAVLSATAQ